jgi:hypothetical protein
MDLLPFLVTDLNVAIVEGFNIKWQGRDINSGSVSITLGQAGSRGVIDYANGKVNVEFRVRIGIPELFETLEDLGADPELLEPVTAVIRSEGVVFEDHSFRLAGKGVIAPHKLFDREHTVIDILAPTRCRPDSIGLSGAEINAALESGRPVTWNFNPTERRVVLDLPGAFGQEKQVLCLAGSYTFAGARDLSEGQRVRQSDEAAS